MEKQSLSKFLSQFSSSKEFNREIVARNFNTSIGTVSDAWYRINKARKLVQETQVGGELSIEVAEKSTIATSKSTRISTVPLLIEAANIDLTTQKVVRSIVNKWEVGMKGPDGKIIVEPLWQVKVFLEPLEGVEEINFDFMLNMLIDKFGSTSAFEPVKETNLDGFMLELSIPDVHIGKYATPEEVGQSYNTEIAEKAYMKATIDLVTKAKKMYRLEKITIVLGNDFMNYDGILKMTTGGTPQDTDLRYTELFRRGFKLACDQIDYCAKNADSVDVIMIPGNHDRASIFYLGVALEAYYCRNFNVKIDSRGVSRKVYVWGNSLLAYTHGDQEKHANLPLLLAVEEKELWGKTIYREWKVGHLHKQKQTSYVATDEFNGVQVSILPSLSAPDNWHYMKGFVGNIPRAVCGVYHKVNGLEAKFNHNFTK